MKTVFILIIGYVSRLAVLLAALAARVAHYIVSLCSIVSKAMASLPVLFFNTTLGAAILAYYKLIISDVVSWMIPCFFIIFFALIWETKTAKMRGEKTPFLTSLFKTLSKVASYACWTIFAVSVGNNTGNSAMSWYIMSSILFIEAMFCIENVMEYHGWSLKSGGIVSMIGRLFSKWLGIPIEGDEVINIRRCGSTPKEDTTTINNNKEE